MAVHGSARLMNQARKDVPDLRRTAVHGKVRPLIGIRGGGTDKRHEIAQDDLHFASSRISDFARYIGLGLAGLAYFLISSDSKFAHHAIHEYRYWILGLSLTGVAVILLDWLQYLLAYSLALEARQRAEEFHKPIYAETARYALRQWAFRLKQAFAFGGAVAFGAWVIILLLNAP